MEAGTLTVQREKGHNPKNRYPVRRLPMPKVVLEEVKTLPREQERVIPVESIRQVALREGALEERFPRLWEYYSRQVRKALNAWRPGLRMSGKDLRNTLQTHALDKPQEWNINLVDRYCGHAPKSVMQKHYFADRGGRLEAQFREQVVTKIDGEVANALAAESTKRQKMATGHTIAASSRAANR